MSGSSPFAPRPIAGSPVISGRNSGTSTTHVSDRGNRCGSFPLSNWTETDVWRYIESEGIDIVPLYFAAPRPVVGRDGMLIMRVDERMALKEGETVRMRNARFCTLGCWPLTGAIESAADSVPAIIDEMRALTTSERTGRLIDRDQSGSMDRKKREGHF